LIGQNSEAVAALQYRWTDRARSEKTRLGNGFNHPFTADP
jgi:hypothetical protein